MREAWKRIALGDVAEPVRDTLRPGTRADLRYVALEHMVPGNPRVPVYGVAADTVTPTTIFQRGDVLFSKLRPYLNKVAIAEGEGCCTGEILVWRSRDQSVVLPAFLAIVLRDHRAIEHAVALSAGSRMPRTSAAQMNTYAVHLPPLEEQQRIVDMIESLDGVIEAAEAAAETGQALLREMGLDAVRQSRDGGWDVLPLAEALGAGGIIQTGPFGSQLHKHDYVDEGVGIVMPANMRNGTVSEDGLSRVTPDDAARLKRHQLRVGDIAWSRRGDVTRFAVINEEQQGMLCGTGCLLVRPDDPALTGWLSVWLSTSFVSEWLIDHSVGATMANLNTKILGRVPVALPPVELRPSFVAAMNSLKSFKYKAADYASSIQGVRSELLSVLLSGEHQIPESYDIDTVVQLEPAA